MTEDKQKDLVTLLDEEGKEHNFAVLDVISVKNNEYAILLPVEEMLNNCTPRGQEAIVFRIVATEDEHTLEAVEDEDEWEMVAQAWEEIVSQEDDMEEEDFDYSSLDEEDEE